MPNLISIGSRRSVLCGDGLTRTGTVVYIHPEHRFAVLEFFGIMGRWRESFYLQRAAALELATDRNGLAYTPEEDAAILASTNDSETAARLGRTWVAVGARKYALRKRMKGDGGHD